jgi:hypothetical protein
MLPYRFTIRLLAVVLVLFQICNGGINVQELAHWGGKWNYSPIGAENGVKNVRLSPITSTTYNGEPRVYYIGTDNQVQELAFWGDRWNYAPIGAENGAMTAAACSPITSTTYNGELRVYYIGTDNQVQELAWDTIILYRN